MNEHERINAAVKKYIDGDKKAFTEIYELTYQATYYYVIGTVKNKEAAEDIISDTYLEVVKSIGTLSSPKAFVSWLRTIAHSKICRYFKKNGREVLVTEEEEPIFDTLENENEEFIPAVALEKESDRNEIIRIINGLSDVQKQTVFMHYFDKMPVAKIAEAMECSENTVKSRLNYARKALKDMFVAEEKKGNKFYSVAPFMFMLFSEEVQAVRVSAELSKRIIESAEIGTAATAAGSGIIGTIKGFFSTAAGKFAAASTAAKAGIGVGVAAVVATACIVPAVVNDDEVVDVVVEETSVVTTTETISEITTMTTVEITESVEATPIEMFEIEFSEDNTYAIISKYIGDEVDVVIPDEVDGVPIKEIGDEAFMQCTQIESILFPDSLERIQFAAFSQCSNLKSVRISQNVKSIGASAFSHCSNLYEVYMEDSVTTVGEALFFNCSNLRKVRLSKNLSEITWLMFGGCTMLDSVEIPDNSIVRIGEKAFAGCGNLEKIVLPEGLKVIGNSAFIECSNLKDITFPDSLEEIQEYAFQKCSSLERVEIVSNVALIGECAFASCSKLTVVQLPDSLTQIDTYAFFNCTNLKEINIPKNVNYIGSYAFANCENLNSVVIPDKVKMISEGLFAFCTNLEQITVSNNITEIHPVAFYMCENLRNINIPQTINSIDDSSFVYTPIENMIKDEYSYAITVKYPHLNGSYTLEIIA